MAEPRFSVGDDVFVRDPQRYVGNCTCIVGSIERIVPLGSSFKYEFRAEIGRMGGGAKPRDVSIHEVDIGLNNLGTPISQLSGRPGEPGFERFRQIGESWGYP
jgi:hypothetical protein